MLHEVKFFCMPSTKEDIRRLVQEEVVNEVLEIPANDILVREEVVNEVLDLPANDVLAQEEVVNEVLDVPCRQVAPQPGLL